MGLPVDLVVPYHPPHLVNPLSGAIVSTEGAEIGHTYAITARDERMIQSVGSCDRPTTCAPSLIPFA